MFDIVELKTDIYIKRYKAEYGGEDKEYDNEESIKSENFHNNCTILY